MEAGSIIAALGLAVLALAHSAAGETGFITPLVNAQWQIAEIPRPAANRLLRTAWHLTSVAWLAMAAVVLGTGPALAVSAAAVFSGLLMLAALPAHPAWPLFLIAGLAGLHGEDALPDFALRSAAVVAAAALLALAAIHLYWLAGGRRGMASVVPTTKGGAPTFQPGTLATLAVTALLTILAGLILATALIDDPGPLRWLVAAGAAVLGARALGDGRYAGFTKKYRDSRFGRADDKLFTPLCVLLSLGAVAAVMT